MKTRTNSSIALLIVIACARPAQGENSAHVSLGQVEYGRTYGQIARLENIVAHLDSSRLRVPQTGGWEDQISNAAQRAVALVVSLQFKDLKKAGLYTLDTDEGDTLVARWNGTVESIERAVWLWDTPFYTAVVMEVEPSLLRPERLKYYCESLFLWERGGVRVKSLKLVRVSSQEDEERVVGEAQHTQTERGTYALWLAGISHADKAFLAVHFSKPMVYTEYPAQAYQVRERFPPLKSRLSAMPRYALFDELGKGYVAPNINSYPMNRDAIFLEELLSRAPVSHIELNQIILGKPGIKEPNYGDITVLRTIAFLQAADRTNQVGANAAALERLCADSEQNSYYWDAALGHIFGSMAEHHVDFSRVALTLLKRGQFGYGALRYLEENGQDEQTLMELDKTPVDSSLEILKKRAVGVIMARVTKLKAAQ